MAVYQPTQAERIILEKEVEEYYLDFDPIPNVLLVQVRDASGKEKSVAVDGNLIKTTGKIPLRQGDSISYIAVF